MSASLSQEKQEVHEMVERHAPSQLTAVRGLLEVLLDPLARSLANAPVEDEEITPEMPTPWIVRVLRSNAGKAFPTKTSCANLD
jgi:hypothetical protein